MCAPAAGQADRCLRAICGELPAAPEAPCAVPVETALPPRGEENASLPPSGGGVAVGDEGGLAPQARPSATATAAAIWATL